MAGISTAGACSYILCASQSHSAQVQQRFNTDSWIEIFNVQGFAQAVCRAVGSSKRPWFEPCRYAADKSVTRNATSLITTDVAEMCEAIRASKTENIEQLLLESNARLAARAEVFERDVYFLKLADPYQVEEDSASSGSSTKPCPGPRYSTAPRPGSSAGGSSRLAAVEERTRHGGLSTSPLLIGCAILSALVSEIPVGQKFPPLYWRINGMRCFANRYFRVGRLKEGHIQSVCLPVLGTDGIQHSIQPWHPCQHPSTGWFPVQVST